MTWSHGWVLPDVIASGNHMTYGARYWEVRYANSVCQAHATKQWLFNKATMIITSKLAHEQYAYAGHLRMLK
jgi:hypothetical protein